MTSQGNPYSRFRRAVATGNLALVRATAAELPRIGVAEAAAMLLVIERAAPESYQRAALRWLAMLCNERRARVDLAAISEAAAALNELPQQSAAPSVFSRARRQLDRLEPASGLAGSASATDCGRAHTPESSRRPPQPSRASG